MAKYLPAAAYMGIDETIHPPIYYIKPVTRRGSEVSPVPQTPPRPHRHHIDLSLHRRPARRRECGEQYSKIGLVNVLRNSSYINEYYLLLHSYS